MGKKKGGKKKDDGAGGQGDSSSQQKQPIASQQVPPSRPGGSGDSHQQPSAPPQGGGPQDIYSVPQQQTLQSRSGEQFIPGVGRGGGQVHERQQVPPSGISGESSGTGRGGGGRGRGGQPGKGWKNPPPPQNQPPPSSQVPSWGPPPGAPMHQQQMPGMQMPQQQTYGMQMPQQQSYGMQGPRQPPPSSQVPSWGPPPGAPMHQQQMPGMQQQQSYGMQGPRQPPPGMQMPQQQSYGMQGPRQPPPGMQMPQQPPPSMQMPQQPPPGMQMPQQQSYGRQMPPQQYPDPQQPHGPRQKRQPPKKQHQPSQHELRQESPQPYSQQSSPSKSDQQIPKKEPVQEKPLEQQSKQRTQQPDQKKAGPKKKVDPGMDKISQKETLEQIKKLNISESGDGVGKEIELSKKLSKGGTLGRKIQLEANHFELKLGRVKKAYHYDFLVTPDTPKKMMRPVFDKVKLQFFPACNVAFDGRKNVYTPYELPFKNTELNTTVEIIDEGGRGKEFKVRVKKVNEIDLEEINKFISGLRNNQIYRQPSNAIQALDVVLRHTQSCYKINVGSSFFTVPRGEIIDLGGGMEMYRGSYQSVTLGWKPFVNIDVSNKAFPKSQNIIDLIYELNPRGFNPQEPLRQFQIQALNKHLKTLKVTYALPNNPTATRSYRVNEVDSSAKQIRFRRDPKSPEITVEDYYLQEKKIKLKFPNMPCLWVGSRTSQMRVRIPAELCKLAPGQAVKRKLDAQQTTQMIRQCATSTDVRKRSIQDAVRSADFMKDPVIREFDLQVDNNFAKLTGRVLQPPSLGYENNKPVRVSRGVWNADRFFRAVEILNWTILCLDTRIRSGDLDNLAQKINVCGRRLGMNIAPPKPFTTTRLGQGVRGLDDLKTFFRNSKGKFDIIFVVIQDFDYQYNYVKEASEISVGCLTQCLKSFTVQRKINDATVTNILLKVNAKLAGTNHHLLDRPKILSVPTMIMGADVTHPSPDSTGIPSVAAVTASHDPKAFQYNICWRLQPPGQEIIVDLKEITKEHLLFFFKKNNQAKPRHIIFFRDGVSNGQFLQVLRSELTAIRAACSAIEADYKPKITFLVVQKRHNTRLFPVDPRDSEDKNKNVPAGTCVDTMITDAVTQNFFLVSHASIQGVAKPTKYVNLWDDYDFTDDELESLTYYLCHMFARCTRSVSYPAPTYYAHLAAARAKVYCEPRQINIDRLPSEQEKLQIKEEIIKGLPMFFI